MADAKNFIIKHWGEQGKLVISACSNANAQPMTAKEFLNHCFCCGGDWGAMLLTGIKALYPEVYDAIPDNMGSLAWACLSATLELLNISTEE